LDAVQRDSAEITEAGWKLTIPVENKLSASKVGLLALLPEVADHLSELREYWRVNRMLFSFEMFLFMIDRGEVEAGDISRIEEFRRRLTSTKELALHCQGKIDLSFSGYDHDPRELYEIDEVRRYILLVDQALPELFFFVRTVEPMTTLKLFLFALFSVGVEGAWPDRKVIIDTRLSAQFLTRHFAGLNVISEWAGLQDAEILRISQAVMKPFGYPPVDATTSD
jgi:hypothetical protein